MLEAVIEAKPKKPPGKRGPKPRVPPAGEVSERKAVQWVFENVAKEGVTAGQAPSWGAWGLLQSVKGDPEFAREFYKTMWLRLIPARSTVEQIDRFSDDNRELSSVLRQNLTALAARVKREAEVEVE